MYCSGCGVFVGTQVEESDLAEGAHARFLEMLAAHQRTLVELIELRGTPAAAGPCLGCCGAAETPARGAGGGPGGGAAPAAAAAMRRV